MKRPISLLIVFISGLTMLADYYYPSLPGIHGVREIFLNWGRIALTATMILGIINLLLSNLKQVTLRRSGWMYNAVLLISFAVTFYYAIYYKMIVHGNQVIIMKGTDAGQTGFQIFTDVYMPLSATIFALVAFYIVSAAFRAFRAKNIEAALLLLSAVIVMIGSIPLGAALHLAWLSNAIQQAPMTAGQRAIIIGVGIGMVTISIKILTGIDQSYFGGGE